MPFKDALNNVEQPGQLKLGYRQVSVPEISQSNFDVIVEIPNLTVLLLPVGVHLNPELEEEPFQGKISEFPGSPNPVSLSEGDGEDSGDEFGALSVDDDEELAAQVQLEGTPDRIGPQPTGEDRKVDTLIQTPIGSPSRAAKVTFYTGVAEGTIEEVSASSGFTPVNDVGVGVYVLGY